MLQAGDLAALLCVTAITLVAGGIVLLRPLARRLPALLETMIEQRNHPEGRQPSEHESRRYSALEARIDLLEQQHGSPELMLDGGQQNVSSGAASVTGRRGFGQ
jgi:hypothetical protein